MSSPDSRRQLRFYLYVALLLVVAAALQTRLPAALEPEWVSPDLALMMTVAGGLLDGPVTGAWLGFLGAYLLTAAIPLSPGSLYFSHIVVGWLSGMPRSRLYTDNPLVTVGCGILAGATSETLFFLLTPHSPLHWLIASGIQAGFGAALVPLFYFIFRRWHVEDAAE